MSCIEYICTTKGCTFIDPGPEKPEECPDCGATTFNHIYDEEI